jgi:lipoyl(octanoyl) transferase
MDPVKVLATKEGSQMPASAAVEFRSLPGLISYEDARRLQQELLEKRVAGEIPDTVLFLEHEPVITRGRGLQWTGTPRDRHMPLPGPLPPGVQFAESERGGDLTVHNPGQLVIYPICRLDAGSRLTPNHDLAAFLRGMEAVIGDVVRSFGLTPIARENATGVWVETPHGERKLASMGIAIRKWVTWHGIALNVCNDLRLFHAISPCGFAPEVMSRLADLASEPALHDPAKWRALVETRIREAWQRNA